MNVIFPRRLPLFLGLTVLAVVSSGMSALAQTADSASTNNLPQPAVNRTEPAPTPGTTATSADAFNSQESEPQSTDLEAQTDADKVAQDSIQDIEPGRATIGGLSYLGVGGSFGTNNAFAIISKLGLTTDLSLRPAVTIEDDAATFRIPITYEFLPIPPGSNFTGFTSISPYFGGGISITTDDGDVSALATAGVDFPLGPRFTGTVNVNVDFLDDTEVAAVIGFGYNFAGF